MKKAVESAINGQIGLEFESAFAYLSMAAYFEEQNLAGFAHWMRMQHQEELVHAMKFFDFLLDSGGHVELTAIPKPASAYKSPLAVMRTALKHEQKVTASINKLYELAVKEKEYPTQVLLQWFIEEQAEEEKSVGDVIAQLEMVGDDGSGMFMMDRQLGARKAEE